MVVWQAVCERLVTYHLSAKTAVVIALLSVLGASFSGCGEQSGGRSSISSAATAVSKRYPKDFSAVKPPAENDDHISRYGEGAKGTEHRQIVELVRRYYAALAAGDGATACSLLSVQLAHAVAEDYGQGPGPAALRGKACATVLSKLALHVTGQPPTVLARTKVTGVRVRGDSGFVELTSSAMRTGEIVIGREGALWRVQALVGRACKDCSPR